MAEYIMKDLAAKQGLQSRFDISSAAVSHEETGNPVYPPARRVLAEHGIACGSHRAHHMTMDEYREYDYVIGMDRDNIARMKRFTGGDPLHKITSLLEWAGENRDVRDPWYTGRFDEAYSDILAGCTALLRKLANEN